MTDLYIDTSNLTLMQKTAILARMRGEALPISDTAMRLRLFRAAKKLGLIKGPRRGRRRRTKVATDIARNRNSESLRLETIPA